MIIEDTAATTTASIPSGPIMKTKSDGSAFGCEYFDCDMSQKKANGRSKHKRWKNFLEDETLSKRIKQFKKENPKVEILLRDPKTRAYSPANKSWWS